MQRTLLALCLTIAFTDLAVNAIAGAQEPVQALQPLLAEAQAAQSRGDFHSAADAYRKATELGPSIPQLWANLGLMDHQLGNSSEAIESFKKAAQLNSSLFVPQLFLGIEYLNGKNPDAALPYLKRAGELKPEDLQAALFLGRAYSMLDRGSQAADSFWKATEMAPNNGNAWIGLGTAYLQQVETDARLMTSTYKHSPFVALRTAETLAEEGKLVDAEKAYKVAIAFASPAPCVHAEFGITLLREKRIAEARGQFEAETRAEGHCGLASLGNAVAAGATGQTEVTVKALAAIAANNPGFIESNLYLFRDALSEEQARSMADLARKQQSNGGSSIDLGTVVEQALFSDFLPIARIDKVEATEATRRAPAEARALYVAGKYAACDQALKPVLEELDSAQQQLLASCAFYTGDFLTVSKVAERQKANPASLAQGLYWETKADQKLAIATLTRAGEIDPDSPRMHVLTGDVFRQKRHWSEAESEYRKALAIDPKSHGARLSLGIVLFTELKTDEAFTIAKSLLAEAPEDPAANLLAGEMLVQEHKFQEAEPYLTHCHNLDPEFVPHLHLLLGQVYAETNRVPEAISEYKQGLTGDENGSVHYQLARLYQKTGDTTAAAEAFQNSQKLRKQWDDRASVVLQQSATDLKHQ
jgi:tetratricopeptide (TPR) repeat protein